MSRIRLSVVIPTYNEANRLVATLEAVDTYLKSQKYPFEILIADDGSADATQNIANSWIKDHPNCRLLASTSGNQGKGDAVRRGVLASAGDLVLFTDADNAIPITELPKLMTWIDKFPIVVGSKYAPGGTHDGQQSHRRLLSRLSNGVIKALAVPDVDDTQCGFKLFQGTAAKQIFDRIRAKRFGFDIELFVIARAQKLKYKEIGVRWSHGNESRIHPLRDMTLTLGELFQIIRNQNSGLYR